MMDKYAMKRARNFRRAQEELPKTLKQAGANKGDVVQGVPAMMFLAVRVNQASEFALVGINKGMEEG